MMKKQQRDVSKLLVPSEAEIARKREPFKLTYDIETLPGTAFWYQRFNVQTIPMDMVITEPRMVCFAAKWSHERKTHFFSEYHNGRKEMLKAIHTLFDKADIVITYNGDKFDNKWIYGELWRAGFAPPSPVKSIDLYKQSGQMQHTSRRLNDVAKSVGLGEKLKNDMELVTRVYNNDPAAWEKFRKYNIRDTVLTEQLVEAFGPWIKGLPHSGIFNGNMEGCYACGSDDLRADGASFTTVAIYPRFQCNNCGAWNKRLRNGQTRAAT